MHYLLALAAGIALAAACGLRVFLPLLAASLGAHAGLLHPSPGFAWLAAPTTTVLLAMATIAEVGAYFIPWIDHLLDTIASPAAVIAGVVVAAAAFGDIDPAIKWTAAVIAGATAAGLVQTGSVAARALSTATTATAANRLLSLTETLGAAVLAALAILLPLLALAILLPLLALALFLALCVVIARLLLRRPFSKPRPK